MKKSRRSQLILICTILFLFLLVLVLLGRQWLLLSVLIACATPIPFFLRLERGQNNAGRLSLIASMVSLSAAGRVLFAPIPFFKPVTAISVLCGAFFGAEAGFLCGSLSALLSNLYFGQGPWTPFQMLSWGLIGFLSGVFSKPIKKSRVMQCLFGALSGVLFSLCMDLFTALWQEGHFDLSRYLFFLTSSLPVTLVYALSNVLFLLALTPLFRRIFQRLIKKYGLK